jgi:hypothetical protein
MFPSCRQTTGKNRDINVVNKYFENVAMFSKNDGNKNFIYEEINSKLHPIKLATI